MESTERRAKSKEAETISEMYTLDSVITMVDAREILDRLAEEKP